MADVNINYHLALRLGNPRFKRWLQLDLVDIFSKRFNLSKSEVKRVIQQGGLEMYVPQATKVTG